MATLLIVHHTPSPAMHAMFERAAEGANHPDISGVDVLSSAALTASPVDVLEADGYLLGSPANLGYLSGAMKHFFDTIYYPCLAETTKRPFGLFLHGNDDCSGAIQAVEKITAGLQWRQCQDPVVVTGAPGNDDLDRCWELGAAVAATIAELG